jgi:hypothetical protein
VVKIRSEKGSFTSSDFDNYMTERGSDLKTIDLVKSSLVNMGFDFDIEDEEEDLDEADDEVEDEEEVEAEALVVELDVEEDALANEPF